jgi:hypothetical protein
MLQQTRINEIEQAPPLTARTISPLEYAPSPPLHRTRRFRRIALLVVLLALGACAWRWGGDVASRAALLYHQRACRSYAAPADQVVFDTDPARVAALATDPNFVVLRGAAFRKSPSDWSAFRTALSGPSPFTPPTGPTALILLHELRARNGIRRLVSLERTVGTGASAYLIAGYDVSAQVIELADWKTSPRLIPEIWAIDVIDGVAPHADIRIFAAQLDPADPSHFTVRYEQQGYTETVDGNLDDAGQITLTRRRTLDL